MEIARRVIARQREERAAPTPLGLPHSEPDIDDYLALFYERAAICQFHGNLGRSDAEREGLRDVPLSLTKTSSQPPKTLAGRVW